MSHIKTHTLISSTRGINLEPCEFSGKELAPDCPVTWTVRKDRLRGGRQEGVDLVVMDNGKMTLRIVPTRGMGIADVVFGNMRLGWDSAVREIVHPMYINLTGRGGTGWLEGFNEYLVRCGLEWMGHPCEDAHHGAKDEAPATRLTLHGRIANIPASEVELEVEQGPPYRITLRGTVYEVMHYGPKYRLVAAITTTPGSNSFTVTDSITNIGGQPQEMYLLYHINHGPPLLEPGSRLVAPVATVEPREAGYPEDDVAKFDHFAGPRPGSIPQVFYMTLNSDTQGSTAVLLHNRAKDKAVSIAFSKRQLPYFSLWKGLYHEADGYVTGLEPGTAYPNPRPIERQCGHSVKLDPGASYSARLDFSLHDTECDVAAAVRMINGIRGELSTTLSLRPLL